MLRALFVLCLLVVAAHAITVDEIRALSNDSRRRAVDRIVQHLNTKIKAMAESSVSRFYDFDPAREPFDVFNRKELIEIMRESFPGFEVNESKACMKPDYSHLCYVRDAVKISW